MKCNRLWELQCKQCMYARTAEGPDLLLLFLSGVMPSRAGQFSRALQSWRSKPSACVAAQLLLYLWVQSVADDSWCRDWWRVGQTGHVCPYPCVHVCTWCWSDRDGAFFRRPDTSMTKQTCQPREPSSRSDELSCRAEMTRVHCLP